MQPTFVEQAGYSSISHRMSVQRSGGDCSGGRELWAARYWLAFTFKVTKRREQTSADACNILALYPTLSTLYPSLPLLNVCLSVGPRDGYVHEMRSLAASGIRLSAVCHRDSPLTTKYRTTTPGRMIFRRSLQCHFSEISLFTRAAALHVVHVEERDVVTMASER